MKYEIIELEELSGEKCSIYSLMQEGQDKTLFDVFYEKCIALFPEEIENIDFRLYAIGNRFGAREQFFKINEGSPGDGVCALYDIPGSKLRLYCVRFGTIALVLGGGSNKPKNIRSWQEDENLSREVHLMMSAAQAIAEKIRNKAITITESGLYGDLTIEL